ncbi:zinc finger-containing ubiquitin peptidase 1 isoform X2 [Echeneis naucrates]|uniref:zinc finger-containing ubiquitin peptidase 1 isoform X2 n=1 Tax=Echeneis naucrates TaxID=173247 RepID=UPI001113DE06|nr:zinc finger-containing ubiquitin peptidase 1 isoform X2 [Echeneis naucrates]
MLTCDICGKEVLLLEEMKTHLLLSHLENAIKCPLCSLSGESYDELCFHISSAHPEEQLTVQGPTDIISSSGGTETGRTDRELSQTSQSCSAEDSCDTAGGGSNRDPGVISDSRQLELNSTPESRCLSLGRTELITLGPETRTETINYHKEDNDWFESGHNKPKEKRLFSPRKDKLFSCPMCALVCNSCFILQEHVELHLEEQHSVEGERRLECPICSVIYNDSFSLQEHVELHLDHQAASGSATVGSLGSDLKLATQLQQEEEQQWRHEAAQQEREDFKKLQMQFGLDGKGGYRRQMERTMEKAVARGHMGAAEFHHRKAEMMESLASGVDDGRTRTMGVTRVLYEYYQTESRDVAHVWLSADTDHYSSSAGDKGWGCGYRNLQMLISCLLRVDMYLPYLQERVVPSIPQLQRMIEEAWRAGLDPQGASHFNQKLQGTRAWIGATEIYSLLISLGISAHIIDFHRPTGPRDTHPQLFDWVKQYYCDPSRSSRLPPSVIQTSLPPLYLQHEGHSRSIVGLEQKKNGSLCLLVLDPGSSSSDTSKLLNRDTISRAIRHVRKFSGSLKHKQYQVVSVQGVLTAEEKQRSIFSSGTLRAERIP